MNLKQVAWNGIRFMAPAGWEAAQIGKQYLLLRNESGPVLEIKWQPVKGRFSHKGQLRRLARQRSQKKKTTISKCAMPGDWQKALERFEAICFDWHGQTVQGKGVILYCSDCRNATLLQFYLPAKSTHASGHTLGHASGEMPGAFARLLSSFRDHPKNHRQLYAIFDIRALVPEGFKLDYFRFSSGEFELRFKKRRQTLALYRWGLASILMQDQDLGAFAGTRLHIPTEASGAVGKTGEGEEAWQWAEEPGPSIWWHRIKGPPDSRFIRVWHLAEKDRILCVFMAGKGGVDTRISDEICADYEIV